MYQVAEIYKTVQGEGMHTGRPAIFVRFAGCNLWNGREGNRHRPACAAWCDVVPLETQIQEFGIAKTATPGHASFASTDGTGGGHYDATTLAAKVEQLWDSALPPFVVLTGGEPTLQIDKELAGEFMRRAFSVSVETNGTRNTPLPDDWHITVSPKGAYEVVRRRGTELKLVFPQKEAEAAPAVWEGLYYQGLINFTRFYLQPLEVPDEAEWSHNIKTVLDYVIARPFWRVSLQTHKLVGLP